MVKSDQKIPKARKEEDEFSVRSPPGSITSTGSKTNKKQEKRNSNESDIPSLNQNSSYFKVTGQGQIKGQGQNGGQIKGQGQPQGQIEVDKESQQEYREGEEPIVVHVVGQPHSIYPLYVPAKEALVRLFCCYCCATFCKQKSIQKKFISNGKIDLLVAVLVQIIWLVVIFLLSYFSIFQTAFKVIEEITEEDSKQNATHGNSTTKIPKDAIFFTTYGFMTVLSFTLGPILFCVAKFKKKFLIILHIFLATIVMLSQSALFLIVWAFYDPRSYTLQLLFVNFHYLSSAWDSYFLYDKLYHKGSTWDDPYRREKPKVLPNWLYHPDFPSVSDSDPQVKMKKNEIV